MERLTKQDLHTLLAFLGDLYATRDLSALRVHLISTLPQVVSSDVTSFNEMCPAKKASENWSDPPEFSTAPSVRVWEEYMVEHPVLTYNLRTLDTRAFKISDFLTRGQFRRTGLYNEFFRRMGMEDALSFALCVSPSRVVGMGLLRSRRNFSERERLMLNLLRPHLTQAYQNAEAVTRTRQELILVRQGTEKLDWGLVVLTPDGRVRLITARARQGVAEYFGDSELRERLPEPLQRWVGYQQALLAGTDNVPPQREPLVVEREGKRLVIRLLSDSDQSLLLLKEEPTFTRSASLDHLGLTRREAEVLAWVAQGRSNYAIGVLMGISERTVKKHLEHIYAKLGVWNRTEAAARARAALTPSA